MNLSKTIHLLLFVLTALIVQAQGSYLNEDGDRHLLGKMKVQDIQTEEFKDWVIEKDEALKLDSEISKNLKDYQVKVFLGTWCGDSRQWVPQFVQLWENSGLAADQLDFIALHNDGDQYKRSPQEFEKGLNIHRVPTFLFYKNGEEVARIVESPKTDLITDVSQIALGFPSKERYGAVKVVEDFLNTTDIDSVYNKSIYRPILNKAYREVSKSSELNTYGYVLKARGDLKKAEFAFYLNRNIFRTNPNTWDSLGEIYFEQEKYEDAEFNYKKVLEMDPKNENAKEMLAKIEEKQQATN